ncbi:hypothetical protein CRUP_016124 [Coryphaenoides rupestris]|nr:hypothetical protein CRUP_016124 [Coryphaenoides rupestris]
MQGVGRERLLKEGFSQQVQLIQGRASGGGASGNSRGGARGEQLCVAVLWCPVLVVLQQLGEQRYALLHLLDGADPLGHLLHPPLHLVGIEDLGLVGQAQGPAVDELQDLLFHRLWGPQAQKGWFKPRVTPPNPFEEAGEDTSRKARQKASKKPANQTEPSEPMSQSKNDSSAPTEKSDEELGEVNKRLEELELGSTQLEKNLRDCNNEEEEEAMLTDWMALIQEKHMLARRDAEITHLSQEQQMMDELLSVVEQRNQIVSSLDEDRQREKEEDSVLEAMQEKEIQKKGLKELKKSRGKFKALEVFRMLSGKAAQESTPESKDEEN